MASAGFPPCPVHALVIAALIQNPCREYQVERKAHPENELPDHCSAPAARAVSHGYGPGQLSVHTGIGGLPVTIRR